MSKEELAALLNGREYDSEITKEEEARAKAAGLVVLFGASDDLAEFRGAIDDEIGCWARDGATEIRFVDGNIFDADRDFGCDCAWSRKAEQDARSRSRLIEALWCAEPGYSWTYRTDIPHATFEVREGADPYCRGIVFEAKDIA